MTSIESPVTRWPSGGCYLPVPREWIGKDVYVTVDGKIEKRPVRGYETGQAYVAAIPCELDGQFLSVTLGKKQTAK